MNSLGYLDHHMTFVHGVAVNSPDPSTKVGALIVSPFGEKIAVGWNSFPYGIPEEWWEDREKKYGVVVHAEVAALLAAGQRAQGSTMFVTHHPCKNCAPIIAAAGIICVICPPGPWRDDPEVVESVRKADEIFELTDVKVVSSGRTQ